MDIEQELLKSAMRIESDLGYLQAHASEAKEDIIEIKGRLDTHIDEFERLLLDYHHHVQAVIQGDLHIEIPKSVLGGKKVTLASLATAIGTVIIFSLGEVIKWVSR